MMAHEFGLVRRILKEHSGLNLGEDSRTCSRESSGLC